MQPRARFLHRRGPDTRASAAQAHARQEGTGDAFDVAADAWEEAGRLKQAERLRHRANELHVISATDLLKRRLELAAREAGHFETGTIEPRGDFWLSEDDPARRGKSLRIEIPNVAITQRFGRVVIFDVILQKTDGPRWYAGSDLHERYGDRVPETWQSHSPEGPVGLEYAIGAIEARYRHLLHRGGQPLRDASFVCDMRRRRSR